MKDAGVESITEWLRQSDRHWRRRMRGLIITAVLFAVTVVGLFAYNYVTMHLVMQQQLIPLTHPGPAMFSLSLFGGSLLLPLALVLPMLQAQAWALPDELIASSSPRDLYLALLRRCRHVARRWVLGLFSLPVASIVLIMHFFSTLLSSLVEITAVVAMCIILPTFAIGEIISMVVLRMVDRHLLWKLAALIPVVLPIIVPVVPQNDSGPLDLIAMYIILGFVVIALWLNPRPPRDFTQRLAARNR